jgi:hypothetical protein
MATLVTPRWTWAIRLRTREDDIPEYKELS